MKVQVDGLSIAFEAQGSGPALLLLHAFPLSSQMWEPTLPLLTGHHRVIRVDARGFGGSDIGQGPLAMDEIARTAAAVLDHLGERTAIVGGASMGGYAALAFVRLFPARLRGLILAGSKAAPDSDEARAGRAKLADKVRAEGISAVEEAMMPKLLGATTQRQDPALVERVRAWVRAARPEAVIQALGGLGARPDARPSLAQIQVPALIVRGAEDVVSSDDDVKEMHERIAGSRTVVIPGAGHLPHLEAPALFERAVGQFLQALGGV